MAILLVIFLVLLNLSLLPAAYPSQLLRLKIENTRFCINKINSSWVPWFLLFLRSSWLMPMVLKPHVRFGSHWRRCLLLNQKLVFCKSFFNLPHWIREHCPLWTIFKGAELGTNLGCHWRTTQRSQRTPSCCFIFLVVWDWNMNPWLLPFLPALNLYYLMINTAICSPMSSN